MITEPKHETNTFVQAMHGLYPTNQKKKGSHTNSVVWPAKHACMKSEIDTNVQDSLRNNFREGLSLIHAGKECACIWLSVLGKKVEDM